jgi:Tfp pilus assembly protein PilP
MTIGDPRKAMLLGFVALAVVAAAIMQLMPKSEAQPIRPVANDSVAPKPKGTDLPTTVLTNAFWHPKLAQKPTKPANKTGEAPTVKIDKSHFDGLAPVDPSAITGNDRELEVKPTIRLIAVIQSGSVSEALIDFGGHQARVQMGTALADLKITKIESTSITLRWGKKSLRVPVGTQVELK